MPQRRARPVRFAPKGCSDAVDGTNTLPGAMAQLANLVPDPGMNGSFVPRPAAYKDIDFATLGFATPGFLSSLLVVGNLAYGTLATARNAGNDEPFCVNLLTRANVPVSGVSAGNTPARPPATGTWTPPIIAQVGSRVVVTHPGFPGGAVKFGWFDVSGFSETTVGDTVSGSSQISGNPTIDGVQPGMTISGGTFAAGTTVVSTANYVNDTTADLNAGSFEVTGVASLAGIVPGQFISSVGQGIPGNTTVVSATGSTIVMSQPANATLSGVSIYFGAYFDGTLNAGSNLITGVTNTTIIGVGQQLQDLGVGSIPGGTTVLSIGINTVTMSANASSNQQQILLESYTNTTGDVTDTPNADLTNVANVVGLAIGQVIAGNGIPAGTTIAALPGGSTVTMSQPALSSTHGVAVTFSGATIMASANAGSTASGVSLTIAGGTLAAPLWGAGDTDRNPLPTKPVGVAQFNGRAYYALGLDGIVFSDSGFACRVSNNPFVQALTTSDGLAVTAVAPLMLSAPLVSTGIVQALLAFEGVAKIQQITGDQTTSNLSMNAMPVATGTAAPLSIVPCEYGTAFVSPEGLRIVTFNATITEPVGDAGTGMTLPFVYSSVPSRMCAAATAHTIRLTTQNGAPPLGSQTPPERPPQQEWWYDLGKRAGQASAGNPLSGVWVGPHTFPASLIQPWAGAFAENTFVLSPIGIPATLWVSDVVPYPNSNYVENNIQLLWTYQPAPLPDSGEMAMNALVDMAISAQFLNYGSINATAMDIDGTFLDTVPIPPGSSAANYFDQATGTWVSAAWSPNLGNNFQQFPIYWHRPIVFKQLNLSISGQSHFGIRIANLNMRYQITGYPLPVPPGILSWAGVGSP